ncbi:MAG: two-component regulator propeller domain-containing protein, partial [Chitinophagales bacterium]
GFMWFGTFDGLDRFDGYNFRVFKSNYNDSNSIEGAKIYSIVEDKDGILWIGTNEALNRYDFKTDHFEHFYVQDSLHQQLKVSYDPFFIDDKNELWFTYKNDLGSVNLATGKMITYPFADGVMRDFPTIGYPERKFYRHLSKIYTSGNDGLHVVDIDKKQAEFYFSSNPKNQFGRQVLIGGVLEDKNHILWLGTENGMISFNPVTKQTQVFNEYQTKKNITTFFLAGDHDDNIWCGGAMGVFLFNTITKKFVRNYSRDPADPESIGKNSVTSLFIDRDNNVWIGIDPDGIDKINPAYEQLNHVKINPKERNTDYSSSIWSIAEIDARNILLCSNHKDVAIYDKITGESKKIDLPKSFQKSFNNNNTILDSHGRIWIASDSGLCYSDDKTKTFKIIEKKDFSNAYLFEYNKRIFIGTGNGLVFLSMNTQAGDAETIHLFDGRGINFIGKSPNGLLCVTTWDKELFFIDAGNGKPSIVKKKVFDFQIKSIFFQDENTLWLGTSVGLAKYIVSQNSLKLFTEKEGLANNYVYCVLKGNDGNLWMSTNHGISRFDMTTEGFTNYGLSEGAQALEYNTHSFFQSPSGTIYFGGVKGLNYFNPSKIKDFYFNPPVQLLSISANGNTVPLEKFLQQSKPVKFQSDENNISIEFAAIDFNRNDNINYLYKLRDKDGWTSIGNQRTLNFANLSPGHYFLEVKAQYSYNQVSPHILKFEFIILSPFYRTYWFIAIVCIVIGLIIYGVYRYRINQFLNLQAIRNKIARDLHDEVGATLSGLSMYSHLTRSQLKTQQTEEVEKSLNIMQESASDMVTKLSDIVWSISPEQDSLVKLTQKLEEYAIEMAATKNMKTEFRFQKELSNLKLPMESRRNMYLFCKEAINNAVKYSGGAILELSIKEANGILECSVRDNGKGFDMQTIKRGNGLGNMQKRANEIGAKLIMKSEQNEGSLFSMQLKIT